MTTESHQSILFLEESTMIPWPMQSVTRRSLLLSLLAAPMACLGCGGEGVTADPKAGEKRRRRAEELQKKADLTRKSGKKEAP